MPTVKLHMAGVLVNPRLLSVCGSAVRTHRTQCIVIIFMTEIYYSRRIQSGKSAKGKGAWGTVRRKPGTSFQESSPPGIAQDTLNFPSNEL
jgi:hypothetical protein